MRKTVKDGRRERGWNKKRFLAGTSLVVQQLRLHSQGRERAGVQSLVGGLDSIGHMTQQRRFHTPQIIPDTAK